MKKVMFACLMAAIMVTFAACEGTSLESSQSGSSITTEDSSANEAEDSSTEESEDSSAEEATEIATGESATLGDWEISVTAWETSTEIADSSGYFSFTPTEGNQFIVVSATVTNNGTASNTFLPTFALNDDVTAKIYYNGEYEYSATQLLGEENSLHDATLNPLTSKSGIIVYDVPPAVTEGTEPLVITFEAGTESITFKLR